MKEEMKKNALNDEMLKQAAGGTGDDGKEWWTCGDCNCGRYFYRDASGELTCEVCGGHKYLMVVVCPVDD